MSADTTIASSAGIIPHSGRTAEAAGRGCQRLPATERFALAALRACYPATPADRLARTAHEAVEAIIQHAGHAGQVVAVTTILRQAALDSPNADADGRRARRAAETIAAAVAGEPQPR
jgi:hypothetical protein